MGMYRQMFSVAYACMCIVCRVKGPPRVESLGTRLRRSAGGLGEAGLAVMWLATERKREGNFECFPLGRPFFPFPEGLHMITGEGTAQEKEGKSERKLTIYATIPLFCPIESLLHRGLIGLDFLPGTFYCCCCCCCC